MRNRIIIVVVIIGILLAAGFALSHSIFSKKSRNGLAANGDAKDAAAQHSAEVKLVTLREIMADKKTLAVFTGNGRDQLDATITNHENSPLAVLVKAGDIFSSNDGSVIVVRNKTISIADGASVKARIDTAALSSSNLVQSSMYRLTDQHLPMLQKLLNYIQLQPELSLTTIQTAVLAMTDNLPLGAFAKFTQIGGNLPEKLDTNAFRVDTRDIVMALIVLRETGVPDASLALTVDPQLKAEAMIDPLAHALAMRYYGITDKTEWDYWKNELLNGNPSTRHYALFGIARYYPDTAVKMLPDWARAAQLPMPFRVSAIDALAETNEADAVPALQRLVYEFGDKSELSNEAQKALAYLQGKLSKENREARAVGTESASVGFRSSLLPPKM